VTAPKRERRQLAKAELLVHLAMTAERWSNDLTGTDTVCRPVAEWGDDDPFVVLCRTYDLTPAELARICHGIGDEIEARAIRAGYDNHYDPAPAPERTTR
jgi:hypothetical protein